MIPLVEISCHVHVHAAYVYSLLHKFRVICVMYQFFCFFYYIPLLVNKASTQRFRDIAVDLSTI